MYEVNQKRFKYFAQNGTPMYEVWITVNSAADLPVPAPEEWTAGSHAEIAPAGSAPSIATLNNDREWSYDSDGGGDGGSDTPVQTMVASMAVPTFASDFVAGEPAIMETYDAPLDEDVVVVPDAMPEAVPDVSMDPETEAASEVTEDDTENS